LYWLWWASLELLLLFQKLFDDVGVSSGIEEKG
jgi:hypothetical protein